RISERLAPKLVAISSKLRSYLAGFSIRSQELPFHSKLPGVCAVVSLAGVSRDRGLHRLLYRFLQSLSQVGDALAFVLFAIRAHLFDRAELVDAPRHVEGREDVAPTLPIRVDAFDESWVEAARSLFVRDARLIGRFAF